MPRGIPSRVEANRLSSEMWERMRTDSEAMESEKTENTEFNYHALLGQIKEKIDAIDENELDRPSWKIQTLERLEKCMTAKTKNRKKESIWELVHSELNIWPSTKNKQILELMYEASMIARGIERHFSTQENENELPVKNEKKRMSPQEMKRENVNGLLTKIFQNICRVDARNLVSDPAWKNNAKLKVEACLGAKSIKQLENAVFELVGSYLRIQPNTRDGADALRIMDAADMGEEVLKQLRGKK